MDRVRRALRIGLGLALTVLFIAPSVVSAQEGRRPSFGTPRDVTVDQTLISIDEAQAQLDYRIPRAVSLPAGYQLAGAFFLTPPDQDVYPDAEPAVRASLLAQSRLRPVGLIFRGPSGPMALIRSSMTVARSQADALTVQSRGLELARGTLRSVDGFEYIVRYGVSPAFFAQLRSFPNVSFNSITWQYVPSVTSNAVFVDALWTVLGPLGEAELVAIAQTFR